MSPLPVPPVRVLVVDDSPTMRALLKHALSGDAGILVVGEAADPLDAREKIKALNPDVVTLDVEMPNMNGLDFLQRIMRLRPTPVIMVSNLTAPGTAVTLEALEIGAFDCVVKPGPEQGDTFRTLPALIKEAAKATRMISARASSAQGARGATQISRQPHWPDLLAIGSSTGGVEALITMLSDFPEDCPPTLIVQHLPQSFTASFAARLNRVCRATVAEAEHGEPVTAGRVYLAPGGRHLTIKAGVGLRCRLSDEETVQGHRPSVDVLFRSIAKDFKGQATGIILTGMGRDGAEGLLDMRRAGATTMAQDEATSLVYGMPRVAHEIGAAERQVPLSRMAREVFA